MWTLIQAVFDIFATLGFFLVIMRMNRAPKDDPRLSRGLQLLQSKISVLEDLSDRTETQASQLSAILEQKCKEVQAKVTIAEQSVHEIRVSMERSLEVAKIFQDKIPHQEIIERQNTLKYVQAARLAHQGYTAEEISKEVDLPKGEIEFIAKVNKDQLVFNEDQLPEWARKAAAPLNELHPPSAPQQQVAFQPQQMEHQHQTFAQHQQQQPTPQAQAQSYADIGNDDDQFRPYQSPAMMQPSNQMPTQQPEPARLRAEMEIAERARLVENLSRLQSEMHNLDQQLAREMPARDYSEVFEAPKFEPNSMQKLGDEFRKACEEAEVENSRGAIMPQLDHFASMIPGIFTQIPGSPDFAPAPEPTPQHLTYFESSSDLPGASDFAPAHAPKSAIDEFVSIPAVPQMDPAVARAVAQAKVQAALQSAKPSTPLTREVSAELNEARAAAHGFAAMPVPMRAEAQAQHSPYAKSDALTVAAAAPAPAPKPEGPVIRRVQFPRIDAPPK